MPGAWKKTLLYLGLGPDEEYDEHFQPPAEEAELQRAPAREPARQVRPTSQRPSARPAGRPDPVEPSPQATSPAGGDSGVVRVIPADNPVVKAVPAPRTANPSIVSPSSFNDAQEIGDSFKGDQPVIINLQGAEKDLARRLIDFASGLCYALGGKMEKVANHVYLLTPEAVEVTAEDRKRFSEGELSR